MKKLSPAFTLIELLVTISIIAILITLVAPQAGRMIEKANTTKCANNLRQIGVAVELYAQDNNNRYPSIESMPTDPVYTADNSGGPPPKPMYEVLSPYGVTKDTLKCPSDVKGPNYFAKEGSSYQWVNVVDEELVSNPNIYTRMGVRNPRSAWLMLARDYENVHNSHENRLYADGHIRSAR